LYGVGQALGDRYRLVKVIGRGGAATVWRAEDARLGRPVAVKVLPPAALHQPGARERLEREARTLAQLVHRNVVAVHDVEVGAGSAYLVMELVDGRSLAAVLAGGRLAPDRVVAYGTQVCDAL